MGRLFAFLVENPAFLDGIQFEHRKGLGVEQMAGIFISYRREDNTKDAHILFECLGKSFGRRVFMDTDGVPYGDNFESTINAQLDRCTVMLVLIGPGWEHLLDKHTGERRLDQSGDWVRIEIAAALRRDIRVIPVLIDRPRLPPEQDLPEQLRLLLKRQAFPLQLGRGFKQGMQDLVAAIRPDMGSTLLLPRWAKVAVPAVLLGSAVLYWQIPHLPALVVPPKDLRVVQPPAAASASDFAKSVFNPPVASDHCVSQGGKDCDICPELVVVPPGSFVMGSPDDEPERQDDEGPRRTVWINYALAVGRYEVTQGQWKAVMGNNPSHFSSCGEMCPVEQVSWNDAQEYLKKLSAKSNKQYRLLSEAEWEYAARAKARTPTPFHTGRTITPEQANFDGNYTYNDSAKSLFRNKIVRVGSFNANDFGLHDMHGNVWEWVEDVWYPDYKGAPLDGAARTSDAAPVSRVLRGGSWDHAPEILRSANRGRNTPNAREKDTGFRIARACVDSGFHSLSF